MAEESQSINTQSTSPFLIGILLALAGCLLFSIKPILIKIAYQYGGDATSIMTLRALSSLPLYVVTLVWLLRHSHNRTKLQSHGLKAVALGILGYYLASFLDIAALSYISAQLERLLIFLFPTFVVLITWVMTRKRPSNRVLISVLLGYLGTSLIFAHDFHSLGESVLTGSLLAIASAFVFAFYLVGSKPLIAQLGSSLFTSVGMGSAGIAILIHLSLSDAEMTTWSNELITIGIALGLLCTVAPSYLVAAAMARLNPTTLSLANNIGPAITSVAAVLVLGEAFTLWHLIGIAIVMMSVVTLNKEK